MGLDCPARGEIWWVDIPDGKRRPAVVVSPDERNEEEQNYIVAACTSRRIGTIYPDEVDIRDLDMPKPSKIQCDFLMTVRRERLTEKITELREDEHIPALNEALKVALSIQGI